MNEREARACELANDILDFVNVFGYDDITFAETIARGNKTLQQSVMQLFITTIRRMAEVPPDERNAETVDLAKMITEVVDDYDYALPLI